MIKIEYMKLKMKSFILTLLFVAALQAFRMPHEDTLDGNKTSVFLSAVR
jgi:hypothetical protein